MQDAVALEKKGIPSVVLVTKPFDSQAKAMADMMGAPGLPVCPDRPPNGQPYRRRSARQSKRSPATGAESADSLNHRISPSPRAGLACNSTTTDFSR